MESSLLYHELLAHIRLMQQFQMLAILISTASIKPSITPVAITTPIMHASINIYRNV